MVSLAQLSTPHFDGLERDPHLLGESRLSAASEVACNNVES